MTAHAYPAAQVFDGRTLRRDAVLLVSDGRVAGICDAAGIPKGYDVADTVPIITPGFVDLQVNGGGGIMFNDAPDTTTLARISAAHQAAGTTAFLPTLVTDTPDVVHAAVDAVADAIAMDLPGVIGLHLEGPHFSPSRKGAHRGDLVRPMTEVDLTFLCDAARRLPVLKVTLSPEAASVSQIAALTKAGIIVSLGHCASPYAACKDALDAGARCVTHLFNAMSQIIGRDPGLVGAALSHPKPHVGLIADGHHVHPANIALAANCLMPDQRLFLVTDAMAPFGTNQERFLMNAREVRRSNGTLRLSDGTLAGADLALPEAVVNMVQFTKRPLETVLRMVTSVPAHIIGAGQGIGGLKTETPADFLMFTPEMELAAVFLEGLKLAAPLKCSD